VLFRKICACALLVTFLAACGGGNQNSSSTEASAGAEATTSPGAMMTGGAMTAASPMSSGMQAMMSRPQQPVPATLHCGTNQPVWTNPKSHAFFEASSPMYGRTKNGTYMCPADAVAAGYHMASGRRHHGNGAMQGTEPSPAST